VPSHSADRSSFPIAAASPAPLEDAPAAAMPALSGPSAAGNGDDLTTRPARNSPATGSDADDVTRQAQTVSGTYIYGYDSAGTPTLTYVG
jgi:hypothetical protein